MCAQLADILDKMERLPWDRMVDFRGRASNTPASIRDIASDDAVRRARARDSLAGCLEHQDGLTQATPPATAFLLEILPLVTAEAQRDVLVVLERVLKAALFILSHQQHAIEARDVPEAKVGSPVHGEVLPAFECEETDEALLEEWDPPVSEWLGWHAQTRDGFLAKSSKLEAVAASSDVATATSAARILELLGAGRTQTECACRHDRREGHRDT